MKTISRLFRASAACAAAFSFWAGAVAFPIETAFAQGLPPVKVPSPLGILGLGVMQFYVGYRLQWCARRSPRDPAGANPVQVGRSGRSAARVAGRKATTVAKRTQRLRGVGY